MENNIEVLPSIEELDRIFNGNASYYATCDNKIDQAGKIKDFLNGLQEMLIEKNKRYGNSASQPLHIFNKGQNADGSILIRLDDKLGRIKNSTELRKNDVIDILGYLTLLCINKDWTCVDQVD